ncbi:hypothetical protein E0H73_08835 [Kribbella pittospori]|uniref:Metalloprotease n=1 Tax=Kribbella pittospori TaxID=722689 RepID=A0A4R0KV43_9ACTN|nr:neutral zinc metallopeptidase [Kribbella pittospori]TCC64489.1 hypothetical protein E0H73_08835 [Kribbella pittospori]
MSGTAKAVVLAIVAVLVAGVAAVGVVWSLNQPDESTDAASASAPAVTGRPTPTTAPRSVSAVNLSDADRATLTENEILLHNPLYSAGQVAAAECSSLPTARLATERAMIRYASAFVECLNRAWAPLIKRSGFKFTPPGAVHSAPTGSDSACGVMDKDVGAFYCDVDQGIYFNWPDYQVEESYWQEAGRVSVQYLMAHEYGHHVQWLTDLADGYNSRWGAATGTAARLREEDRNEMQAHCFAAAFFGANQKTLRLHGEQLAHYGHPGFQRTEVGDNFGSWLRQGFRARGPSACNTWAVPWTKVKFT